MAELPRRGTRPRVRIISPAARASRSIPGGPPLGDCRLFMRLADHLDIERFRIFAIAACALRLPVVGCRAVERCVRGGAPHIA